MSTVRCGALAKLLLAAYVMTTALLSFSHHDLICHLKSSTHCTTCLATSSGEAVANAAGVDHAVLRDAGRAAIIIVTPAHSAPIGASSGRSPPSLG